VILRDYDRYSENFYAETRRRRGAELQFVGIILEFPSLREERVTEKIESEGGFSHAKIFLLFFAWQPHCFKQGYGC